MKELFYNYISDIIRHENILEYEWRSNNTEIIFKKKSEFGFDVIVGYEQKYIYLYTDYGYHENYEMNCNFAKKLIDVLGIVRDLLSSNMRIKEYLSNNRPYKWTVQCLVENEWYDESKTSLIFWNYFGKKTEKIYFNDSVPKRKHKYKTY